MVLSGKTLTFIEGNTHEGMHWTIVDEARGFPIDITGATINVFIQGVLETDTIINRVATIIDPTLGTCNLIPTAGEMDVPGSYKVQLHIVFADATEVYLQKMSLNIISVLE